MAALLVAVPLTARAADEPQASRPQGTTNPVIVERVQSGFVGGPDVRFTRVNDRDATLVGGYGGWLVDNTLLVGGAGYWLANGDDRLGMAYGGFLVEWYLLREHAVDVSLRGLLGAGSATLSTPWTWTPFEPRPVTFGRGGTRPSYGQPGEPVTGIAVFDTGFFVAEPQVNLVWHAARHISLTGGVGYRAIGAASGFDDELRGVYGTVAIRFGGGR